MPGMNLNMFIRLFPALALMAALLAGCAMGPDYVRPEPDAPAEDRFANDSREAAGQVLAEGWWQRFNDQNLNMLVEEAVERNLDLREAAARVLEARAVLTQTSAPGYPSVELGAMAERSKVVSSFFGGRISNQYSLDLGLNYELDLWGRIRRLEESAIHELMAAEEDRIAFYQSLVADVIRAYVDLISSERQHRLAENTVEIDRQNLELVESRYNRGLVPALDVYLARQSLAASEARVPLFVEQREQARHRLNLLRTRYPAGDLAFTYYDSLPVPEQIPVGLPAELLERRPDIRSTERRLMAANARIGAAKADMFPRISLTVAGGLRSSELSDLLNVSTNFWSLLGNLSQPVFQAGAKVAAVRQAEARTEAAAARYAGTVLRAFREVEDALVIEQAELKRREALRRSVEEASESFRASRERYLRGLDNLIPSLDARRTLYTAEAALIATEQTLLLNRVALHLALGGDWGHEEALAGKGKPGE